MKTVKTCAISIWLAGDMRAARSWLRRYCYHKGFCITVTPSTFIYTGGEETGFCVGLVNYPRFPSTPEELEAKAIIIAEGLVNACCQRTALVVGPRRTTWVTIDPPGAK